ncbi:MAG: 50S ribosomal protein L23 [Betaproteobacteria bacterium SG8_41]|jgi:large subunit ribosomal protein L23|nr:MAG: 50S ribosomal protein L23 [Betaproteobacteria bacterium SG8_41]
MTAKGQERLMQIILAPVISEKSTFIADKHNHVVFRVAADANKHEIKAAVELMFSTKDKKVEVAAVQVANVRGKTKTFGRFVGRRNHWKKAYVSLKPGQEINFAEQVEMK